MIRHTEGNHLIYWVANIKATAITALIAEYCVARIQLSQLGPLIRWLWASCLTTCCQLWWHVLFVCQLATIQTYSPLAPSTYTCIFHELQHHLTRSKLTTPPHSFTTYSTTSLVHHSQHHLTRSPLTAPPHSFTQRTTSLVHHLQHHLTRSPLTAPPHSFTTHSTTSLVHHSGPPLSFTAHSTTSLVHHSRPPLSFTTHSTATAIIITFPHAIPHFSTRTKNNVGCASLYISTDINNTQNFWESYAI